MSTFLLNTNARRRTTRRWAAPEDVRCSFVHPDGRRCPLWANMHHDRCARHSVDACFRKLEELLKRQVELEAEIAAMRKNIPVL